MISYYAPKLDLTLTGCGFLGIYYFGAFCLLERVWPQKPFHRICGASCGGLVGAILVSGVPVAKSLFTILNFLKIVRQSFTNPSKLVSINQVVSTCLDLLLPQDAHQMCTNRLGISLTTWPAKINKLVSEFTSRQDLIEAVCAGCFIPFWSGSLQPPAYKGELCLDGAYTDNAPKFEVDPEKQNANPLEGIIQISLSPFYCGTDICPNDGYHLFSARAFNMDCYFTFENMRRTCHAMLPFSPRVYRAYLMHGFEDMKQYVIESNLIKCPACSPIDISNCGLGDHSISVLEHSKTAANIITISRSSRPCLACLKLMEQIDNLRPPKSLLNLFCQ